MKQIIVCGVMALLAAPLQWPASSNIVTIPVISQSFELGYGAQSVQNLGVTPKSLQSAQLGACCTDGVYILKFSVQNNPTGPKYPGYYEVEVDFGTQELCYGEGWGTADVSDVMLSCPGPQYLIGEQLPGGGPTGQIPIPGQGNEPLVLTFTVPGSSTGSAWQSWPILFSNLSFTFTPIPCQKVGFDC